MICSWKVLQQGELWLDLEPCIEFESVERKTRRNGLQEPAPMVSWEVILTFFRNNIYQLLKQPFGEGNGTPLQYSCLENPMDGGAWWAAVHGAAKSWTRLSDFTFTFHFHALEKEIATHSSVLAWRIPGIVEPDGLPSMGWHRVRHDWSDLATAAAKQPLLKIKIYKLTTN